MSVLVERKFEQRTTVQFVATTCSDCRERCTVYDRDREIGRLPANLAKQYGDAA